MLRVTMQDNSAAAKSYYAAADYYTEGQEIVGRWGGEGAKRLGLDGTVGKEAFERLCDNLHPTEEGSLTALTRSDRRVGYDFTFSVPKSVSLLYAIKNDRNILDALHSAVDETMHDIEAEMKTRVRKNSSDLNRMTGNMVWAEFIHTTSRPVNEIPDPHLHAHCFALNSTWDPVEGRWKAGQFADLKRDAPYFQAAFRVRLANKLQDLGYGVERKRDDFEIVGVPKSAIKGFSRRTQEIEKVAAERGITDPKRKAELGAETREKKAKELSWNQLRREWDKRLSEEERDALTRAFQRDMPYAQPVQGEGAAVDYALGHAFTREAVVPERKLEMLAMQRGLGSVTVEDVKRELAGRDLIRGEHDGKRVATTREMARDEARLIKFAVSGRGRYRPLGNPDRPLTRQWLNDDQKRAVRHVLGSRDAVTIIRGAAGTGKTTAEQELGEAFAEAGLPVVAIAQGAEASRGVLRNEAKFEKADTVARFLVDKQMQGSARQGVILVDEAGQLGTKDMLRVFDVAKELDARVVLVGDRRQHRSVAAGEPLRLLEERAGLPVAEVTEILRQSGDYRNASRALSEGRVADGFALLDQLGWIREAPEGDRYRTLADAYLAATAEKTRDGKPKTALVISPTHAEAARTTASIRLQLKADKKLGEERTVETWAPTHLTDPQKADSTNYETGDLLVFHQNAPDHKKGSRLVLAEGDKVPVEYADRFEVYRPMELRLAPGDRIRTTANGWTKDGKHRLNNGRLDTVKRFTPGGNPVLENGWVLGKDCHITHGYVVTSHASQGKTVHKVFVSESLQSLPAANRRQFYVSISRGKEQVVVFTDDKQALLKAVERTDEPLSATELAEARKVRLRQRLHKHLAFVRRLATFARTHEQHSEHRKTPSWEREKDYVR